MQNVAPKLSPDEYEKNFAEIHPALSTDAAVAEASRCLYCYDSPCTKACPTHIDIPTFIKKIASGNLKGSAKTILEANWIALTCAKACPVEVLCEGACVYNNRGEVPIRIGRLQRYAIDTYFESGMPPLFSPAAKIGLSVGVVGAGAAGLACAAEAALLGFDVTVYDSNEKPGGLNTRGIAPYKTTQADALREVDLIRSLGVVIKSGVRIGESIPVETLLQQHDAVFLGVGLGKASRLNIPGEDLPGVVEALEFIEKVTTRNWTAVDVGRNVAVIGAGNTAIDAATEARRLGAERVTILYRRSRAEMPAFAFEFELAKSDGVAFEFLTAPVRIVGHGHVEAVECRKMRLGEPDAGGRRKPVPIEGSEFLLPMDMVIMSAGQGLEESFVARIPGLEFRDGRIAVNEETLQTTHPKVFAGGDCINGGKEVVNAAADGKRAAHGINSMLKEKRIAAW